MRLSAAEYRRGLVTWKIDAPATVQTGTAFESLSRPLLEPSGSVVESQPRPGRRIHINIDDRSALQRPYWVRWEYLGDAELHVALWEGEHTMHELVGVPSFGQFHRLVVATPYLDWQKDAVFRIGEAVVKMMSTVVGETATSPLAHHGATQSTFTQSLGTVTWEGRLIEIIVPAQPKLGTPSDIAFTVVGLLAAVVGDGAVGQVLLSQGLQCDRNAQDTLVSQDLLNGGPMSPPERLRLPRLLDTNELDAIDSALSLLFDSQRTKPALFTALRWYEHGIRAWSANDTLLAHHIGIEVLTMAHAKSRRYQSPIAKIARDERIKSLLEPLGKAYGMDALERLVQRLANPQPSPIDCVEFFIASFKLDESGVERYRRIQKARNKLVHGSSAGVNQGIAQEAQELLRTLLQAELNNDQVPAT